MYVRYPYLTIHKYLYLTILYLTYDTRTTGKVPYLTVLSLQHDTSAMVPSFTSTLE